MINKTVLPNGVRIVTEYIPHVKSVSIGFWVATGSRDEEEAMGGVSHFIEHLLFKGTQNRSAKDLAEVLEAVGGQLNAFTAKEYTCYYAKVLDDHLDLAIDVLADMFFNSLFDAAEIDKERGVVMEEIKMYEDTPDDQIHDLFAETLWPDHSLGRPILGTAKTLKAMNREKILQHFREEYRADRLVIAAAGQVDHDKLVQVLSPIVAPLTPKEQPVSYKSAEAKANVLFKKKDTEQVQICIGVPSLRQDHPQLYALHLMNSILGGGLSSRLFQEIREERGLAYSVYSYHTPFRDCGLFSLYAGASPERMTEVVDLLLQETNKITALGITERELTRTREQIKGGLYLGLESVSARMNRLAKSELLHGRYIPPEEVVEKVFAVTQEDIRNLAMEMFQKDKFNLTVIGPVKNKHDWSKTLEKAGF